MSERDTTQDMWVFEDGGDCLGVYEWVDGDAHEEEGERYVPASQLEAVEKERDELRAKLASFEGVPNPDNYR
jgi:hypothetical protein